jgi:prolyl oligopeptidase
MYRTCFTLIIGLGLALSPRRLWADVPPLPSTPKKPVTDVYHGVKVLDDYRWLEAGNDPAVRQWTEAQNRHTRATIDQYPGLPALRQRIKDLSGATPPAYLSVQSRGGKLFALKSQPPKDQPFLILLTAPDDPQAAQVIFDPNVANPKGTTTIDFYVPSNDGQLVAISLSENGSEEGTVHVHETATGKARPDVVPRVAYPTGGGSLVWNADGTGFWYTRYPRGSERPKEDLNFYQQVYFHKLGTPTEADTYEIGKEFPRIAETMLQATPDGRYVLATVANGDGGEYAHYLRGPSGQWTQLTSFADKVSAATFGPKDTLYLLSRQGAPRGRILRLPLTAPKLAAARQIVPESDAAIEGLVWTNSSYAVNFAVTANRLYVVDLVGGPSRIRVFDLDGHPQGVVPLEPVSSAGSLVPLRGDDVLFRSQSYVRPPAWFRFDPATGQTTRTALFSTSPVDFGDIEVVREFATSRDGTRIPLNILQRKGTPRDGRNPTLLTGYGGFGISQVPRFSSLRHVWLEQGGVYAVANLRGGSEFGEEWHHAGNLTRKQNVFDDFAACARHLIERKYTSPDRLAIQGGSNGGLLMGASLTQHPELFRAVVTQVGIYDMLRFEQHPNGVFNVTEYGSVKDPEQFKALHAYSPYQNVKDGTAYPAVLILTGANDGRVDPANSRKFVARLQAATSSKRPVLLLIDFGSGHGAGTSLSATLAQQADVNAFLFQQLGVEYRPVMK